MQMTSVKIYKDSRCGQQVNLMKGLCPEKVIKVNKIFKIDVIYTHTHIYICMYV